MVPINDFNINSKHCRDERAKLNQTIVKMQKQQTRLEQELKEKESELEDLGCWRALLAKVLNINSM